MEIRADCIKCGKSYVSVLPEHIAKVVKEIDETLKTFGISRKCGYICDECFPQVTDELRKGDESALNN